MSNAKIKGKRKKSSPAQETTQNENQQRTLKSGGGGGGGGGKRGIVNQDDQPVPYSHEGEKPRKKKGLQYEEESQRLVDDIKSKKLTEKRSMGRMALTIMEGDMMRSRTVNTQDTPVSYNPNPELPDPMHDLKCKNIKKFKKQQQDDEGQSTKMKDRTRKASQARAHQTFMDGERMKTRQMNREDMAVPYNDNPDAGCQGPGCDKEKKKKKNSQPEDEEQSTAKRKVKKTKSKQIQSFMGEDDSEEKKLKRKNQNKLEMTMMMKGPQLGHPPELKVKRKLVKMTRNNDLFENHQKRKYENHQTVVIKFCKMFPKIIFFLSLPCSEQLATEQLKDERSMDPNNRKEISVHYIFDLFKIQRQLILIISILKILRASGS